jgi:hypothetical protein
VEAQVTDEQAEQQATHIVVKDTALLAEGTATNSDIIYCYSRMHAEVIAHQQLACGWNNVSIIQLR